MNIKIQDAEEYIPYGEDWEKEMMKLPKKFLIEQLKNQWQQSQQPEIDKLISDYKYLLANFTSCPQIIIDNPSFVQGKKPTEKDMEWAREKIKEYEADLQSQQPKEADGWISVEDDVPKTHKESVLVTDGEYYAIGVHIGIGTYKWDIIGFLPNEITHWQPLPSPPKK